MSRSGQSKRGKNNAKAARNNRPQQTINKAEEAATTKEQQQQHATTTTTTTLSLPVKLQVQRLGIVAMALLAILIPYLRTTAVSSTTPTTTTTLDDYSMESLESLLSSFPPLRVHTIKVGRDQEVFVVKNFLPTSLAEKWRRILREEWNQSTQQQQLSENTTSWRFATNNDGYSNQLNQKFRSLENITLRNQTARERYQHNRLNFNYAKWELLPSHPVVQEMERTFTHPNLMARVQAIVNATELQPVLSDLFVTYFGTGDFLSTHDDGLAGSHAFVVSLMDGPESEEWLPEFGGQTRFECLRQADENFAGRYCQEMLPSFNSALLFRTRSPRGPFHEVMPVSWQAAAAGFYRFGLTGWYMEASDTTDERFLAERDKMKNAIG